MIFRIIFDIIIRTNVRIRIPTVAGSEGPRGEEGATELLAVEVGVEAVDLWKEGHGLLYAS